MQLDRSQSMICGQCTHSRLVTIHSLKLRHITNICHIYDIEGMIAILSGIARERLICLLYAYEVASKDK